MDLTGERKIMPPLRFFLIKIQISFIMTEIFDDARINPSFMRSKMKTEVLPRRLGLCKHRHHVGNYLLPYSSTVCNPGRTKTHVVNRRLQPPGSWNEEPIVWAVISTHAGFYHGKHGGDLPHDRSYSLVWRFSMNSVRVKKLLGLNVERKAGGWT